MGREGLIYELNQILEILSTRKRLIGIDFEQRSKVVITTLACIIQFRLYFLEKNVIWSVDVWQKHTHFWLRTLTDTGLSCLSNDTRGFKVPLAQDDDMGKTKILGGKKATWTTRDEIDVKSLNEDTYAHYHRHRFERPPTVKRRNQKLAVVVNKPTDHVLIFV